MLNDNFVTLSLLTLPLQTSARLSFCLSSERKDVDVWNLSDSFTQRWMSAQADSNLCYILDAILIIYGIVLTVLYCRLRMRPTNANNTEKQGGGIYEGLQRPHQDTYDTLHGLKKKPLA
ncbi:Fc receptor, IgE, high affinity I, gamma polypeptide like isoform X1 [Myxocyprinus asiaticus]|uniref:Fc receptor, IgE, high affinity I, gamma polypeptide like isoform X1 n=1 Tax=Myxocyprinus asiaticus TaxID=70543 RepID=UPI0022225D83|nr:Fc receptor, IgE, high affinity I, gamma polypeptide like isoform X1 [Myxocyprinus asiaticus]